MDVRREQTLGEDYEESGTPKDVDSGVAPHSSPNERGE
jgi:hypothetical protein